MILIIGAHNMTPDLWSMLHTARLMYTTYVQHTHNQHLCLHPTHPYCKGLAALNVQLVQKTKAST